MAVTDLDVQAEYTADGVGKTYAIPFEYDAAIQVKVYLDGVASSAFTIVSTNVVMTDVPTAGVIVKVKRVTAKTQPTTFTGTTFDPTGVEASVDRLTMLVQELGQDITDLSTATPSVAGISTIKDWEASTLVLSILTAKSYILNQVVHYDKNLYRCLVAYTNTVGNSFLSDLGSGYWEKLVVTAATGVQGPQGNAGVAGAKGDKGDTGAAGADGADGADGVFSAIASKSEAEGGTENTKGMTALRTKEAIDYQVPNLTAITDLETRCSNIETAATLLTGRVAALEALEPTTRFIGKKTVQNPQVAWDYVDGLPDKLERDFDQARSVKIYLEIKRKTDVETRFANLELNMQCVDDVWYLSDVVTILEVGNQLGIEFDVYQDPGEPDVGKVRYRTTDTLAGTAVANENYIKYVGEEISMGI